MGSPFNREGFNFGWTPSNYMVTPDGRYVDIPKEEPVSEAKKLQRIAVKAAQEAAIRERGRCLWLLDQMVVQTDRELAQKVLIERDRQIATAKLAIMKGLAFRLRAKIVTGEAPKKESEFEDYIECEECFDQGTMYHGGRRLCEGCYNEKGS